MTSFGLFYILGHPVPCTIQVHICPSLSFAADIAIEALPCCIYVLCKTHLPRGFGFANPIPACSMLLYSSWITCPCIYLPHASFLCWSFGRSSLFSHTHLLPPSFDFLHIGMNRSRVWRWSLASNQISWSPLLSKSVLRKSLPSRPLKKPRSALLSFHSSASVVWATSVIPVRSPPCNFMKSSHFSSCFCSTLCALAYTHFRSISPGKSKSFFC